jgi:deleted in liver cancer protein
LKWALILLPDQKRGELQLLVTFLARVSSCNHDDQKNETNLAVCIAPSVFHYDDGAQDSQLPAEAMAGIDCLSYLIKHHENLFSVDQEMFLNCQFSSVERCVPVSFDKLGEDMGKDWKGYVSFCRDELLEESKTKSNRGWVTDPSHRQQVCGTIQI